VHDQNLNIKPEIILATGSFPTLSLGHTQHRILNKFSQGSVATDIWWGSSVRFSHFRSLSL